jgi:hypothetical protein
MAAPALQRVSDRLVIDDVVLARAMLKVARVGADRRILDNEVIRRIAMQPAM